MSKNCWEDVSVYGYIPGDIILYYIILYYIILYYIILYYVILLVCGEAG
jgi:hypothetical protein